MLAALVDLLCPPICHGCGRELVEGEQHLCMHCYSKLPRTNYMLMPDVSNPMTQRFAGIIPFEVASSWLFYSHGSMLSAIVQDFKYRAMPDIARKMGQWMGEELLMQGFFSDADAIMPVPIHWRRRLKRGYNQAEMIAKGVADTANLELITNLKAVRSHKTQTKMTLQERQNNLKGSFRLKNPENLRGRHIVLIDDICTTGATLLDAAEATLAAMPDCRLSLLSLACTV